MSVTLDLIDEPKDPLMRDTIARICPHVESILDVGCGLSLQSRFIETDDRVGLDIYQPFLERIETHVDYTAINADALDIDKLYAENSFDVVLLVYILEHLDKESGLRLMEMAEHIARRVVYVQVPHGFIPQNIDIWGEGGNEYQTHRSGWFPEEFMQRGYWTIERDYTMRDIKRHDRWRVEPKIKSINAMYLKGD